MTIWGKLAGLLPVDLTLPKEIVVVRVTKMFPSKPIVTLKFQALTMHEPCVTRTSILNFPVTPGDSKTVFMSYRHYQTNKLHGLSP
jgi:hypothetical protein